MDLDMADKLYEEFLQTNGGDILNSLEILAASELCTEVEIPSMIVGEVVWGLGYGNQRLDPHQDYCILAERYIGFKELYDQFKLTSLWKNLEKGSSENSETIERDAFCLDLYDKFIRRFARPIFQTLETLKEGENVVEVNFAVVDVLQKMGYAKMLPYFIKGIAGFVKTDSFDSFYERLKQTKFYRDIKIEAEQAKN